MNIEQLGEQIKGLTTLINAKFDNVEDNFEQVHSRLDKINGRVNKHETAITDALIERSKNREEQKNAFCKIDKVEKKVEEIEKELEDLGFFLRHPKLFIGILVTITIITLATFLNTNPLKSFNEFFDKDKIEQLQQFNPENIIQQ